jgi:hypothetical protein
MRKRSRDANPVKITTVIRHRVGEDDHFIQFVKVTKGQGKNVGGFPISPPRGHKVPLASHG